MIRLPRLSLRAAALAVAVLASLTASPPSALAGPANSGLPGASHSNPLAGVRWGAYTGSRDEMAPAYNGSSGTTRALLGKVFLRPRMRWFGYWYPVGTIGSFVSDYLQQMTGGSPNVMAQFALFSLEPWEGDACRRLPTAAEQQSYRARTDAVARAIGATRVAVVLQPDLPFQNCVPHHSLIPMSEVAYSARILSALPHTTVYIDAGAGDWPTVGEAATQLRQAGVRYARGFALNATHYDSTENEVRFGARVSAALARAGLPGKHFVVNTSSNGHGFTYQQLHSPSTFDNARVCRSKSQRVCASLGIPPTTDVANARWHLSGTARRLAARYADGYMWIGRPWLHNQNDPFDEARTLALAASSPF
jgi:hypothetical protein